MWRPSGRRALEAGKRIDRSLVRWALEEPLFPRHMAFVIGPRQSGKTTLARAYLAARTDTMDAEARYLNWDNQRLRARLRKDPYFFEPLQRPEVRTPLVFDEIHKMRGWKSYLKGVFDSFSEAFQLIVTGSGRLDLFQRGGDSLAGRYDPYFLFPLTPGEVEGKSPLDSLSLEAILDAPEASESTVESWERLGGFPEPFLTGRDAAARRWWSQYRVRVTEEDVRDLTRIEAIDSVRDLLELLPARVASPLSQNALREDLECAHATVARYLRTLHQVFFIFSVPPYWKRLHRAIKKEQKTYFFHHAAVSEPGARFENMVALLLSRWTTTLREQGLSDCSLHYLRDQDRREVDFVIVENGRPRLLLEAKRGDTAFASAALFYHAKLGIPIVQVVRGPGIAIRRPQGLVVSIHRLC